MRGIGFKITVILALGLLFFGAWLTRNPDAEILERATKWPVVGSLAKSFRDAYRPAEPLPEEDDATEYVFVDPRGRPLEGGQVGGADPDRTLGARPVVWVGEGTAVLAEPSPDAAEIARTGGISNLRILERRDDWFQVLYRGQPGWVYVEDYAESEVPPMGSDPLPPGPLQAQPPDAERLAYARELIRAVEPMKIGPYEAHAARIDAGLVGFLDRVVGSLEQIYSERYAVGPVGNADGAIVLFDRHADFAAYEERELATHGLDAAGVTGGGVIAIDVDGRLPTESASTLVHEIVHLLNRRALGPALPPWLEEGLADDLAQSEITEEGTLETSRLGGVSIQRADRWEWRGALASAVELRRALDEGRLTPLDRLVALDWDGFVRPGVSESNYGQASFWVRHLLADPETAVSFKSFLAGIAGGGSAEGEELRRRLGADWSLLDDRFQRWIRIRFHDPT